MEKTTKKHTLMKQRTDNHRKDPEIVYDVPHKLIIVTFHSVPSVEEFLKIYFENIGQQTVFIGKVEKVLSEARKKVPSLNIESFKKDTGLQFFFHEGRVLKPSGIEDRTIRYRKTAVLICNHKNTQYFIFISDRVAVNTILLGTKRVSPTEYNEILSSDIREETEDKVSSFPGIELSKDCHFREKIALAEFESRIYDLNVKTINEFFLFYLKVESPFFRNFFEKSEKIGDMRILNLSNNERVERVVAIPFEEKTLEFPQSEDYTKLFQCNEKLFRLKGIRSVDGVSWFISHFAVTESAKKQSVTFSDSKKLKEFGFSRDIKSFTLFNSVPFPKKE